jgi:hypothetical protein
MGQCQGTHLFSAECNTWQLASLKWRYMQEKMLWAAYFLAVATNIRHHEGLGPPSLWPPQHSTMVETLKSVGHLTSYTVHPSGRPCTWFDQPAPVPSFSFKHVLVCGHCTACRMCWDLILARIASSVPIRSVRNISMAVIRLQQASEYHSNESVRWSSVCLAQKTITLGLCVLHVNDAVSWPTETAVLTNTCCCRVLNL